MQYLSIILELQYVFLRRIAQDVQPGKRYFAGISGFEGIFLGDATAKAKGFESDRNYQMQSSFALLSYAAVALIVLLFNWGVLAELTIFFSFIIFLFLSGINHAVDAIKNKNYKWQNINRPFITFLLIAGMAYPVIEALKRIN